MPPTTSAVTCPNCHAAIKPGSRLCPVCKLEVAKMAAFAAAKQAAQKRGFRGTAVESNETPAWRSAGAIIKVLLLVTFLGGVGWAGFHFFGPKPPRYAQFPATATDAAKEFMTRVSGGDNMHHSAYALIADSARSKQASDDEGDYLQVFHTVNDYLAAEFGSDWISQATFAPDPADPNVIITKVAIETLHIRTRQQTPPDQMQKYGPRVGIIGIDEVDVNYASDLRQIAVIGDFIGGVAGQSAKNNLDSVLGASAANRHQPPFIKKMSLLAVLRNPHATNWRVVIQTDPLRTDPVIRARLSMILTDERYELNVHNAAKEVLDDKVTEEERISVGL